jgi:SP family general alpha glucoside:H+ symporter-like MFS transporter
MDLDDKRRAGAQHETSYRSDQAGLQRAEEAANNEKAMSLRETWGIYRKAILWSMVLSTALIMEGYDVVIVRGTARRISMV